MDPRIRAPGKTAIFRNQEIIDSQNLGITSFLGINDDGNSVNPLINAAYSKLDAWNLARGVDRSGNPIIDPETGKPTRFPFNGDPVTGKGWIYPHGTGGGAGFQIFTGPFTLAPRDSQWVMMVLIAAQGEDSRSALTMLRQKAEILRSMSYSRLTAPTEGEVYPSLPLIPEQFILHQNFPNPFNASTILRYELAEETHIKLDIYNLLGQKIKTLIDDVQPVGLHEIPWEGLNEDGVKASSGIYFYRLKTSNFVDIKKMSLLR